MKIYKVESPSGKIYVGQTVQTLAKRRAQHESEKSQTAFANAIRKYGKRMKWSIIDRAATLVELNAREKFWIKELNTLAPHGYNLTSGGHNGGRRCAETLARMSVAQKGKSKPKTVGEAVAAANRRRVVSAESRAKMSAAKLGNKNSVGKRSAITRMRMSAAAIGKPKPRRTATHCANLSAAGLRRWAR